MRQISDELLLNEIKELINNKKTPLTKENVLEWINNEQCRNYCNCITYSMPNLIYKVENRMKYLNEISIRNADRLKKAYDLINSLEDYDVSKMP